ncbi:MAG: phosphoglycolate phosphatase [Thermoplasmata archaeon]|nr:phosphoglycolate phosphatase [Thermoplasmata archaeon]MCI4362431.1 phosphoglycolate phosphatase [Thermoplasmata archaeon]
MRRRPSTHRLPLRAVVTDIDGTLTDASRRLNLRAVELLRSLQDRGIVVVLATGNVLPIALALHRFVGLTGPIVAENGGILYRRVDGVDRVETLARRTVAVAALEKLERDAIPVRRLFTDRWRETEVALEPSAPVRRIRAALKGSGVTVESTGFALHLMEAGAGKRTALDRALAPYGLTLADCVVAGDGDNDVAMLRAAGYGVSFPNGSPRARAAARYVSRRAYADGFVEALKQSGIVPTSRR